MSLQLCIENEGLLQRVYIQRRVNDCNNPLLTNGACLPVAQEVLADFPIPLPASPYKGEELPP